MKLQFYGVRGSFPVPGKDTIKYGGNTTCVTIYKELADGSIDRVILDAGSGIINLGRDILKNYKAGIESLDLMVLITHLHPDHTQGFPFFGPNYFKDCKINLYGMETLNETIGAILEKAMLPPNFPIEYKDLKSTRSHYIVKDGDVLTSPKGAFQIEVMWAYASSHPQQGAMYYKITDKETGKSVACIWDHESKVGGDKAVIRFSKDCDVMIHDTQYTTEEYLSESFIVQGFGHSTHEMALDNAIQAGIKSLVIGTHHNPVHTDEKLDKVAEEIAEKARTEDLEFELAIEGKVYEI